MLEKARWWQAATGKATVSVDRRRPAASHPAGTLLTPMVTTFTVLQVAEHIERQVTDVWDRQFWVRGEVSGLPRVALGLLRERLARGGRPPREHEGLAPVEKSTTEMGAPEVFSNGSTSAAS